MLLNEERLEVGFELGIGAHERLERERKGGVTKGPREENRVERERPGLHSEKERPSNAAFAPRARLSNVKNLLPTNCTATPNESAGTLASTSVSPT